MLVREQLSDGRIRLTFGLPTGQPPGEVSVVGSFNDWIPGAHPLRGEDGEDTRTVSLEVEPGTHHFRYLATGGVWFDDEQVDGIDEIGGIVHCHRSYAPVDEESILGPDADPDAELDADPTLGTGIAAGAEADHGAVADHTAVGEHTAARETGIADADADGNELADGGNGDDSVGVDDGMDSEPGSDPDPGADVDGDGDGEPAVAAKGGKGRRARASAR